MMAGVGRLFVGGGAVLLGYTITNNALNKVTNLKKRSRFILFLPIRLRSQAGSAAAAWTKDVVASLGGSRPLDRLPSEV